MGKKTNNGYTVSDLEKYAPTSWGKPSTVNSEPYDYTTGSGQTVLIKRMGMLDIFKLGLLDQLDFFTKSISEGDDKKQGKVIAADTDSFAVNLLKNFDKLEETVNKVLLEGVIAPKIVPVPAAGPTGQVTRVEGLIYVDSIPFEDRIELFGEMLDTEGLSDFRQESEDGVGHVPAVESVPLPAE